MEVKQRGRKRKQPSSNPFTGICTRQKSQIFFHNNRSGKSRPDPLRKTTTFPVHPPSSNNNSQISRFLKSSFNQDVDDDDDEAIYHISIKDLRARRVFSKPVVLKEEVQLEDFDGLSEVDSGENLNPNLYSEPNDGKTGESGRFEKSSREMRSDGGLLIGRSDSGTDLRNLDCSDCENPNLSVAGKCDPKGDVEGKVLNGGSPNLSMLHKCDSGRVDYQGEGLAGEKPNLSVEERCRTGIDFKEKRPNDENSSSLVVSIGACDAKGETSSCSEGQETLEGMKEEKFEVWLNCAGKISDHSSPNLSDRELKGANGEACDVFPKENVQTTPPDAVIQVQQSDDGSALRNRNTNPRSPPKEISPSKVKKCSSDSKRNMVLKPCSRMKVFRAPNSFSYRRLLPYLMDIAKDTSSAVKVNPCPKIEIDAREKPLVSSSQESLIDTPKSVEKPPIVVPVLSSQEGSINRKEGENGSLEPKASDLKTEQVTIETPVRCSQDESQANGVSPQNQIENLMENDSHKGDAPPDEQVALDTNGTLQDVTLIVEPIQVDSSLASKGSPEASKKDANLEAPCQLSLYAEGECRTAHVELKADESSICVFHSSSKLEAVVSSVVPAAGLARGILKRNPRGCRGICNCLNCASFRLNAGKAFDFSRNQMLDAEELVVDMMKELANLRVMLEKPAHGGNCHAILPVDQVQEACRRASNMEDIARNRLNQMNEDLYVHCRTKSLKRPRVNFSSYVEKKVIGKSIKLIDQDNACKGLAL